MKGQPPDALPCAVRALTEHTDICTSVLACEASTIEQLGRVSCAPPDPAAIRELQSHFGTIRRTYRPLLELHPSLPLELAALLRRRAAPPSRGVDLVLSRCREPLAPLFRLVPALVPRHAHLRIFVYERCGWQGSDEALDLRDELFGVVRHALPAAEHDAQAFSAHLAMRGVMPERSSEPRSSRWCACAAAHMQAAHPVVWTGRGGRGDRLPAHARARGARAGAALAQ